MQRSLDMNVLFSNIEACCTNLLRSIKRENGLSSISNVSAHSPLNRTHKTEENASLKPTFNVNAPIIRFHRTVDEQRNRVVSHNLVKRSVY